MSSVLLAACGAIEFRGTGKLDGVMIEQATPDDHPELVARLKSLFDATAAEVSPPRLQPRPKAE